MPRSSIERMQNLSVKMPAIVLYAVHEAARRLGLSSLAEFVRLSLNDFMEAVERGEDVSVDFRRFVDSVARRLNIGCDMLEGLLHLRVFPFKVTPSFRERLERFRERYLYSSLGELVRHAVMWKVSKVLFEEGERSG